MYYRSFIKGSGADNLRREAQGAGAKQADALLARETGARLS